MAFDTKSPEVHAAIINAASKIESQTYIPGKEGDADEATVLNRRARNVASLAIQIYCHLTDENVLTDAVSSMAMSRVQDVGIEAL